jgi:hypothetical protein
MTSAASSYGVRDIADLAPRTIVTSLLRPGDQIVTADLLRATVTVLDARDPKLGRWVECVTEDGRTLRFAARADLAVTRLRESPAARS